MKIYIRYFLYLIVHKKNIFIEAIKMRMFIHAITHDLSKFLPSEFIPYANYFYGDPVDCTSFKIAWLHHQNRNPHHWGYWLERRNGQFGDVHLMPEKYVKQMICDWKAMSRISNDNWKSWFADNKLTMVLNDKTILIIEKYLSK